MKRICRAVGPSLSASLEHLAHHQNVASLSIVCTPPFLRGRLSLQPNFQKGVSLIGPLLLEGVVGKEGHDFFQGGCNFHIKNKLKSEIINDKKKFISKNVFLCHN